MNENSQNIYIHMIIVNPRRIYSGAVVSSDNEMASLTLYEIQCSLD